MNLKRLDVVTWCGYMVFAATGIALPVSLPEISKDLATSLSEGGGLETARCAAGLVVLIIAGACAHRWGKRPVLSVGLYFLAFGLANASLARSYASLVLWLMVASLGTGSLEALINPLVVDLHPVGTGRYLNGANAFYPLGVMVSAYAFGELLTLGCSWRTVFRLAAGCALVEGLLFHGSRFPNPVSDERNAWPIAARILRLPGFWLFAFALFLAGGAESSFLFWSRSYVETYLATTARIGALAVSVFAGALAAGRFVVARLTREANMNGIMLMSALIGVFASGAMPLIGGRIGFWFLVGLSGVATACFWPTILAEAAHCLRVNPTILFVLLSCSGLIGFGFAPWLMGVIGDRAGLRGGFWMIPALFLLLAIVLLVVRPMSRRANAAAPVEVDQP